MNSTLCVVLVYNDNVSVLEEYTKYRLKRMVRQSARILFHAVEVELQPVRNLSHIFSHVNHTSINPEIFTCNRTRILTCKLG